MERRETILSSERKAGGPLVNLWERARDPPSICQRPRSGIRQLRGELAFLRLAPARKRCLHESYAGLRAPALCRSCHCVCGPTTCRWLIPMIQRKDGASSDRRNIHPVRGGHITCVTRNVASLAST